MRSGLWLLLSCGAALPQPQTRLTIEEAVETALRQNPAVAAARGNLETAVACVKQARAPYFPQMGVNGVAKVGLSGATNELGLIGLPNSPFYRNFADSLNVRQRALDFGRTAHELRRERFRRDIAEADLEAAEARVIAGTKRAYFGVLRARRLREVAAAVLRSREWSVRQAQAFYEGGIRSRLDLDLSRAARSQAELELMEAENSLRVAVAELGRTLASSQEADYLLEPPDMTPPEPEPLATLIETAGRLRPDLRALEAEREAALESVRLARSRRKPLLSFAFSGGYARFTNVLARQLLAGGIGLALPLFTGGELKGQIEEAEARAGALGSRLEDLNLQVELETRNAYWQLQNALQSLPVLALRADYARQALRLARERYRERLGTIVELNHAETALAQAETAHAIGNYAVMLAGAELDFAVGRR